MAIHPFRRRAARAATPILMLLALGACTDGRFDFDLRDLGGAFDTSDAAARAVADRPEPDNRGVISYPAYQVAVARRGDTVGDVAGRVGLPVGELAAYNGLPQDVPLRRGEIVALPRRVAEPSPATGAPATGPIRPPGDVRTTSLDVENRAGDAIRRAESAPAALPQTGQEPIRHKVARGETAFSIARLYNVPARSLAEWNGLEADMALREGQYLLIPVAAPAPATDEAVAPGTGSVAPIPPSAAQPLPDRDESADISEDLPPSPNLGAQATDASGSDARFVFPVEGRIIRPYRKGSNDGIDIAASPGTEVRAAGAGSVAAITRDTDQVPILVLRHDGNILTVYAGVDRISVKKGDRVSRGQAIARVRDADPAFVHFEVREGFDSVDPVPYLN